MNKLVWWFILVWAAFFFWLGPVFYSIDPDLVNLARINQPPSFINLAGTDELGRDVLARTLSGGRISLFIGFLAAFLSLSLGTIIGLVSGYWEGRIDWILMRLADMLRCLPSLLILLVWQSFSIPSLANIVIVISLISWISTARFIRGQVISLKGYAHVLSAKAIACPDWMILKQHILPYCCKELQVLFVLEFSGAVLLESSLSFLGLGLPVNCASWGNMLSNGECALVNGYWWQIFYPGTALFISLFLMYLLGGRILKR